jgi:beta-glucosidase
MWLRISGLDMNMPGGMGLYRSHGDPLSCFGTNVTSAVKNVTLDISSVDDMIARIMTPSYHLGQDKDFPSIDPSSGLIYLYAGLPSTWVPGCVLTGASDRDVRADHHTAIRKMGAAAQL